MARRADRSARPAVLIAPAAAELSPAAPASADESTGWFWTRASSGCGEPDKSGSAARAACAAILSVPLRLA